MKRWRRSMSSMLALTAAAGGTVLATAVPAAANESVLWVGKVGETHGTFGANAVVRIWGKLQVKTYGCDGGVNDFVYPTSDVYLVAPGAGYGQLEDVTGGRPNTVVQYATVFDDEVVAMTQPGGTLPAGTYDVVFDTCQDGYYDEGEDTVFPAAITVAMPAGGLPAPDGSLQALKNASYDEYESWKKARSAMNDVWKQVEKAIKTGCKTGNVVACAMKYGNYFGPIKKSFDELLVNQGVHYLGIYEDPPNPDFDHAVLPAAVDGDEAAIAGEGALTEALLHAVEAYKGAQQAGDREWALAHARTVVALHEALAAQLDASDARLAELQGLFSTSEAADGLHFGWTFLGRIQREGFSPDERRALLENGLSRADVTALQADVAGTRVARWLASDVQDALGAPRTAHSKTKAALAEGRASWQAIVDALAGDPSVPDEHPVAEAGPARTVVEGQPVTLAGSGSAGADLAWDVDGDRDFDDATGAGPTVTFDRPGPALVGLRARDAQGRTAYDWTTVSVQAAGSAPVVNGTPAERLRTVVTGSTVPFGVTTTDDAGTPSVAWTVDGDAAGQGTSLSWQAPTAPGTHEVVAAATDQDGHVSTYAWTVNVHRPDGDHDGYSGLLDCDDTDAVIHPGQTEFLGNGVDDDCDDGTPDAPPGGLTGTVWGWGDGDYGTLGTGTFAGSSNKPLKATVLPTNVVQVEASQNSTHAVLDDGRVLGVGYGDGSLGDGTYTTRLQPVKVLGPGGTGQLSGVRRLTSSLGHLAATLTTGKVVTWGNQTTGTFGDGSTITQRPYPDYVLTSAGGDPLTGVATVEAGHAEDYALMDDGTVKAWGQVTCDGVAGDQSPFPKTLAGLSDIRQIATSQAVTLFLRKDGTVLSCGGTDEELGRDWNFQGKSPYVPLPVDGLGAGSKVVDISITGDAAMALKEDGTVLMWGRNTNASLAAVCGAPMCSLESPQVATRLPAGPPVISIDNADTATPHVIRADGSVVNWGGDTYGAGGDGKAAFITTPQVLDVPGQIVLQTAGYSWRTLALTRPKSDPQLELPAGWVSASVDDAPLAEGGADNGFTVAIDHPLTDDVSVSWRLEAGTAGDADATYTHGSVVIPAGRTSARVPVDVADDQVDEDDETVVLTLTGADHGLRLADASATGTIADDDDAPVVSVANTNVVEGDTSLTDTPVTFRLSRASGKEVVAHYATADGTAQAGKDYVGSAAEIRFAPGETEHVVHLGETGDTIVEPTESFSVALSDASGATVGSAGTVTITDDEVFSVEATGSTAEEGSPVEFQVTVNPAPLPGVEIRVPWSVVEVAGGEGDADGDAVPASGTAVLSAEHPSVTVSAATVDDTIVESPEPLLLQLGSPTASDGHVVKAARTAPSWIADNDVANQPPAVVAGAPVTGVEGSALALAGSVTDDAGGVTSQWTVDGPCTVAGAGAATSVTCRQDGAYVAVLTATDAGGLVGSDSTVLTVANAAPVAGPVTVDGAGATVEFTDPGADDSHTCRVQWGDGSADGVVAGAISPCHLAHAYQPGTYTATVTVTDDGGLSFTTTRQVTVQGTTWPWRGFLSPVKNLPAVNEVKAGSSVPIKFSLGGDRGPDIFAAGSPSSTGATCGGGRSGEVDPTETPGSSSLSYDARTDTYTYVWKTEKSWAGTCRKLTVTLADGSTHVAEFRLK